MVVSYWEQIMLFIFKHHIHQQHKHKVEVIKFKNHTYSHPGKVMEKNTDSSEKRELRKIMQTYYLFPYKVIDCGGATCELFHYIHFHL